MRELKSYVDPYHRKPQQAFFGPYRATRSSRIEHWLGVVLAVVIGLSFAVLLVVELSK